MLKARACCATPPTDPVRETALFSGFFLVVGASLGRVERMFDALGDGQDAVAKLLVTEDAIDVGQLARLRTQLEAVWLRAVERYDRSGEWQTEFQSAAAGLRSRCNMTAGAARFELRLARKIAELPVVAAALADASITRRHAAAIAESYTPERADALHELEPQLVAAAKVAAPRDFGEIMQRVVGALDGDDGASAAYEKTCRRSLHASRTFEGMVRGDFVLDPESGEEFLRALDAMREQTWRADDRRTAAQQRADAMMDLVRTGVTHADVGAGRNHRPELTVCVDLADLEARGADDVAAVLRSRRGPYSKETLRRLACDGGVSRVLTDGPSRVLDVGRKQRNPTSAQWRAVIARDGMRCNRCGARTPYLELHHRQHWADGGETSLENLEGVCHPCHVEEHEGKHAHGPP